MRLTNMREYTKKLLDLVDEGCIDKDKLVLDLLNWMSEDYVKEFYEQYYESDESDEEEDLEDYDPILDKGD